MRENCEHCSKTFRRIIMFLYIIPFLVGIILYIFCPTNKALQKIFVVFLCLFLCFSYTCGSDWRSYENMYVNIADAWDYYVLFYDIGYLFLVKIFASLDVGFWPFFVLMKCLIFAAMIWQMKRYLIRKEDFFLAMIVFLGTSAYFLFIDCPFRNLIAIGISTFSYQYLFDRRLLPYIAIIGLASLFHSSFVLFIPIYFIVNWRGKPLAYAIIFAIVLVVFFNSTVTYYIARMFTFWSDDLSAKVMKYSAGEDVAAVGSGISLGLIVNIIYFFLFIRSYKAITSIPKYGVILYNLAFLYFIFYRLALTIPVVSRFQYDLTVFYCIVIPYLSVVFVKRDRVKYAIMVCIVSVSLATKAVTDTYKYVPYTHYLIEMIKGNKMDYNTRSSYNPINSPYK